jgi:hypothetical protein
MITCTPSVANTSSKDPENFESRSRMRRTRRHLALVQLEGKVPRLLGDEGAVRILRCAGDVNASSADLDEEQHVEGLEERGFHGEEVHTPRCLRLGHGGTLTSSDQPGGARVRVLL